jgi:glycosyltransferase involved in cell wall biosynthesis
MKIVLLGRYNNGEILSGPEKVASRIFGALSLRGDEVSFIEYFFDGSRYALYQKLFGSEYVLTQQKSSVRRMGIFPLLMFLISNRNAVVHIVTFERFAVAAFWLKKLLGLKILYTVNGIVQHENTYFRAFASHSLKEKDTSAERVFMEHSDLVFFLSEESRILAMEYYDISESRTRITANGIDEMFSITRRVQPAGSAEVPSLVFVGDVARPEKGFEFLLQALLLVRQAYQLFVIGESDSRFLPQLASIPYKIVPKMTSEQYAAWLADKDIFISASKCDQFGIAAAEAMAAGLAVIATKETGMSRYITPGVNGLVIDYGSVAGFASAIDRLCTDHGSIARMGEAGAETMKTLTWRNVAETYRQTYQTVAS